MTVSDRRRPITATDFNRLLFALLLLAALAVLARLITRQETRADTIEGQVALAQWVQAADALFLKREWSMAADAYFGALEAGSRERLAVDPSVQKKLALCLSETGDSRSAVHFLRMYRQSLLEHRAYPSGRRVALSILAGDKDALERELAETERLLKTWEAGGA